MKKSGLLGLGAALAVLLAGAVNADEPLRVYTSGAPGASIYVTPAAAISAGAASNSEVGIGAFDPKYYRGRAPLTTPLAPGLYMVSVMPQPDYSMNDALMKAREFVWDGYDYHAIVDQRNTRWRYAQCYLVEKQKDFAAEVLAVFTDQMPDGEALTFDLGRKATRYAGTEEEALAQLEAAKVPFAFSELVFKAVQEGLKVLARMGTERWIVVAEGPEKVRVLSTTAQGAWAGHRISICSGEKDMF